MRGRTEGPPPPGCQVAPHPPAGRPAFIQGQGPGQTGLVPRAPGHRRSSSTRSWDGSEQAGAEPPACADRSPAPGRQGLGLWWSHWGRRAGPAHCQCCLGYFYKGTRGSAGFAVVTPGVARVVACVYTHTPCLFWGVGLIQGRTGEEPEVCPVAPGAGGAGLALWPHLGMGPRRSAALELRAPSPNAHTEPRACWGPVPSTNQVLFLF